MISIILFVLYYSELHSFYFYFSLFPVYQSYAKKELISPANLVTSAIDLIDLSCFTEPKSFCKHSPFVRKYTAVFSSLCPGHSHQNRMILLETIVALYLACFISVQTILHLTSKNAE